jgi:hypothetical protein
MTWKEIKYFVDLRPAHLPLRAQRQMLFTGRQGVSSGCPTTTHVGTPASADTDLCPASHVTLLLLGQLTTRVNTSAAGA